MKIEKKAEVQLALEKLGDLINRTPDGTTLSWVEIEQKTGVKMDQHGRHLFHRARAKAGREHLPLRGSGVVLSEPKNAVDVVRLRDRRIAGAARRANRADARIQHRHIQELNPQDREEVLMRSALRGALISGSKGLTKLKTRIEPPPPQLPVKTPSTDALARWEENRCTPADLELARQDLDDPEVQRVLSELSGAH